jgi:predicted Zn-dependent protease with MMP-like domain
MIDRMRRDEFDEQVRLALDEIPDGIRAAMDNVVVLVEEENDEDPDLYGFYVGTPLPDRSDLGYAGATPDAVLIYRRPLTEDFADDLDELRHEIRTTVLHELAHHFGIDEDELDRLGYG